MNRYWNRKTCHAVAPVLLLVLTACAPLLISSSPDTYPVPPEAASQLRGTQGIALSNAYKAETKARIYEGGAGWDADLRQYTSTAIALLGREMEKKGIAIGPSSKSAALRVSNVRCSAGWVIQCDLALEAQFADGSGTSVFAQNVSPATAWRAVDGAIMRAVGYLLSDPRFVAYVNTQ